MLLPVGLAYDLVMPLHRQGQNGEGGNTCHIHRRLGAFGNLQAEVLDRTRKRLYREFRQRDFGKGDDLIEFGLAVILRLCVARLGHDLLVVFECLLPDGVQLVFT